MNVFYEEDGSFKAGTVLADQGGAFQVQSATGKRTKVKAAHVLVEFREPEPQPLLTAAHTLADEIDLDFLWECAPQEEFGFRDLGADYFGHEPTAIESAALLLRLHGAPMYFYRKGRGRYRPAPPDALKAALASIEKKRQQTLLKEAYLADMAAGKLPDAIRDQARQLLFRPDKNSLEFKALEDACAAASLTPARLLLKLGAFASARAIHEARFLSAWFPHGTGFPELAAPLPQLELPTADVAAFSVDDHTTTEIDDAFSVQKTGTGWTVGIHIAAPSLAIARGDPLDVLAHDRYSTVYMPGEKITMLPDKVVGTYTLAEGSVAPAVSLYVDLDADGTTVTGVRHAVERIPVAHNLRHNQLEALVTEEALASGTGDYPCKDEIAVLWRFAQDLHRQRQEARVAAGLRPEGGNRPDYNFYIEGGDGSERVTISARRRDAPLDRLVAELMILANCTWGRLLADNGVSGIYRVQQGGPGGRVRMTTHPAPHQGLGVAQYAWSTSPLRRYVDLVNQWQIVACITGGAPAFERNDAELFAIISGFEAAYAAYAEHQAIMERYWCLRWIRQEDVRVTDALVTRDEWARLADIPLQLRLPGLPSLARGTRIEIELLGQDELDLSVEARVLAIIEEIDAEEAAELEEDADDPLPSGLPGAAEGEVPPAAEAPGV